MTTERIERGSYAEVKNMHEVAMRNGWIAMFCHDTSGFFLRLIGKVKPSNAETAATHQKTL